MLYTLLFNDGDELHALGATDLLDAIANAQLLITGGALDLSIIGPSGKAVVSHQQVVTLTERLREVEREMQQD